MTQTIRHDNKHILEQEFRSLNEEQFNNFLHDDDKTSENAETTLGIVYHNIDEASRAVFMEVAKEEYKARNSAEELQEDTLDLDTETALLEAIKGSNIGNMSIFSQSRLLEKIEEEICLDRTMIENYLDNKTVINESVVTDNELFTKIQEALKIIQPVNKPEISITLNEQELWNEIRANDDWLLESKIKTYLTAKSNEYQAKTTAHKAIAKEVIKDDIHEINKLQLQIIKDIQGYDINKVSEALDDGLGRYNTLKETLDISVPRDNSLLSKFIRYSTLKEAPKVEALYEQAEAYLLAEMKGSKKSLKSFSFFDYKSIIEFNGTDTKLKFLGQYYIILKETKESFRFNIVTKPFVQSRKQPISDLNAQIEEDYITDLLKAKKTLERQYIGKKFQATADTSDTNSVNHIDTNGWRIHLYNDPKESKAIDYNIEYYPHNYKKSDLTETEIFHATIEESLSEKKFAKALENGEHIFVPDTGVVLWYSLSDKKFMIDMKSSTFEEVYNLYKKEDKRHHNTLKTENERINNDK